MYGAHRVMSTAHRAMYDAHRAMHGTHLAMYGAHNAMQGAHRAMHGTHRAMYGAHKPMQGAHRAMHGVHRAIYGDCFSVCGCDGFVYERQAVEGVKANTASLTQSFSKRCESPEPRLYPATCAGLGKGQGSSAAVAKYLTILPDAFIQCCPGRTPFGHVHGYLCGSYTVCCAPLQPEP